MVIEVQNKAGIPNKYIRFVKWKIRRIQEKFDDFLYVEVYVDKEGTKVPTYYSTVKLGIRGDDLVFKCSSDDLAQLWRRSVSGVEHLLRENKKKKLIHRSENRP